MKLLPVVLIVAFATISSLLIWLARNDLPSQIAVHWGADGRPDGFAGFWEMFITNAVMMFVFPLLLWGLGLAVRQERPMGAIAPGLSAFLGVLFTGSTLAQRDMNPGEEAGVTGLIWIGVLAGLAVGLLLWFLLRRKPDDYAVASGAPGADVPTLRVSPTTRVAWTGYTRVTGWIWLFAGIALAPMLVVSAVFAVNRSWSDAALMLLLGVALSLFVLTASYARVTIDVRGVRVSGAGVIRWVNVPLANIQAAEVTTVDPVGDFGGYGRRVALGGEREGMVTSKGQAILIERADERPMVVTIDDARRAAATLNTLLVRDRRRG
ncbi:DUF1648 domain-containing protein [Tessaracoccus caeni]|uniref:DUF1648 domain-containing protein n=1 Tax=Tessaracoccus caeni TaxID=3031239 RepID=UPI0023DB0622|nr:DUF1648 domain-containing protein [Tessaracoccus caeni]MDF1488576.1 DUF1648 domain-containing protein [Tessaracoccus caeni]